MPSWELVMWLLKDIKTMTNELIRTKWIGNKIKRQDHAKINDSIVDEIYQRGIPTCMSIEEIEQYPVDDTEKLILKGVGVYEISDINSTGSIASTVDNSKYWVPILNLNTETDPIFTDSPAYNITQQNIDDWNEMATCCNDMLATLQAIHDILIDAQRGISDPQLQTFKTEEINPITTVVSRGYTSTGIIYDRVIVKRGNTILSTYWVDSSGVETTTMPPTWVIGDDDKEYTVTTQQGKDSSGAAWTKTVTYKVVNDVPTPISTIYDNGTTTQTTAPTGFELCGCGCGSPVPEVGTIIVTGASAQIGSTIVDYENYFNQFGTVSASSYDSVSDTFIFNYPVGTTLSDIGFMELIAGGTFIDPETRIINYNANAFYGYGGVATIGDNITFFGGAFNNSTGNNIIGNGNTFDECFRASTGNNTIGDNNEFGTCFKVSTGDNTIGNGCIINGETSFSYSTGDNTIGNISMCHGNFTDATGNNTIGIITLTGTGEASIGVFENASPTVKNTIAGIVYADPALAIGGGNQLLSFNNYNGLLEITGGIGTTVGQDHDWAGSYGSLIINAPTSFATNNGGNPEGDFAAIAGLGATVNYVL